MQGHGMMGSLVMLRQELFLNVLLDSLSFGSVTFHVPAGTCSSHLLPHCEIAITAMSLFLTLLQAASVVVWLLDF